MSDPLPSLGLDLVAARLQAVGLGTLTAGPVRTVLGRAGLAGGSRPLPSSAAELRLDGEDAIYVPAPEVAAEPDAGRAPLYRYGGRLLVLPTIRLFVRGTRQEPETAPVEYLSLSDWLLDAVAVWRFAPIRRDCESGGETAREESGPRSLLDQFARVKPKPAAVLHGVATLLYYALFGADGPSVVCGLRLPASPMWLRPVGETAFARNVDRALVVTARLDPDPARPSVPTTNLRAAGYRIRPAQPRDWGLDPVHTPEGNDIRLTGRLGVGVAVRDRRLEVLPCSPALQGRPPLSASTARLPFAGYDDPRRLLMGANMQAHAMPLPAQEPPRVRTGEPGGDPPGVNLRVAYLAWQGWNHEDAWVLSESAAQRLGAVEEVVQTIAIRAVELAPEVLVRRGDKVERGQRLVLRFVAPVLLCPALEVLANLPDLDDRVQLQPETDDFAPEAGTVSAVEEWDPRTRAGIPAEWEVPEAVAGAYRAVYRVHIERRLPLAVGDKLANRHGHKGVVGTIVPDAQMPRWRGQPLEALIDPISVLNRSNWGQVYESLAGALVEPRGSRDVRGVSGNDVLKEAKDAGADEHGRWPVAPPAEGQWMTDGAWTVAGVQFVMRMPHHARDRISGSPVPAGPSGRYVRPRAQRLGEMEHWALWAHGGDAAPGGGSDRPLSGDAARLGRLLGVAGFDLGVKDGAIRVGRLALDAEPPEGVPRLALLRETKARGKKSGKGQGPKFSPRPLAETYDDADQVTPAAPAVLVFDPPFPSPPSRWGGTSLRWLPVLPACDRPPRRLLDGSEEPHELTADLRRVLRAALRRARAQAEQEVARLQGELSDAAGRLMDDAYAAAVGRGASGQFSSKRAFLRRGLLGRRLPHSARATVSPGGTLYLDLDEIGLPRALVHTLFGPDLPAEEKELAEAIAGRRVWLKRDPVLHRWGLLSVRVRPVDGDTIRLPASLLGPLGADFDGDTVALFASLPGAPVDLSAYAPPALAWHPVLKEAMFKPGKQYHYGLYLLARDDGQKARLQEALRGVGAPPWPDEADPKQALRQWTEEAVRGSPEGRWWAILERHALDAVAADPAMGFGLGGVDELARLPVVRCGASKDLYGDDNRATITDILEGRSLDIYRRGPPGRDPIADVMVAAKASIGQFGGALRRLVYSAENLRPGDIQLAQTLTEQVTQKALSVKAGKPPLVYADFERQLRRLLTRQKLDEDQRNELEALLAEIGKKLQPVWEHLCSLMPAEPRPWLEWLRKPHELADLVVEAGEIRLPLDDLRLRGWTDEAPPDPQEGTHSRRSRS